MNNIATWIETTDKMSKRRKDYEDVRMLLELNLEAAQCAT
jgi:hypothetical protein